VILVVTGEVEQWVDRDKRILRPGDCAFIPAGVVHASFNTGIQRRSSQSSGLVWDRSTMSWSMPLTMRRGGRYESKECARSDAVQERMHPAGEEEGCIAII
jgi:Cupin domain